jgi:hypothetical protein
MSAAKVLQAARAAGIHFAVDGNDLLLTSSVPPPPGTASAGFGLRVLSMRFAGFAGDDRSEPISYVQEL